MGLEDMDWKWLNDYVKGMMKPVSVLALVVIAVALSYLQKLGLECEMVYSIFRCFFQLSIVGFVLQFIFNQQNVGWIFLVHLFMVFIAAFTAGQHAKHVPRGKYIAMVSIIVGSSLTLSFPIILKVFPFTPSSKEAA